MVIHAFRVSVASTIATALAWFLVSAPVAGQEGGAGGAAGFRAAPIAGCPQISRLFWPCAEAKAATFNPARNPDGTPNMNGAWSPVTANGSQNIQDFAGDAFLGRQISIIVDPPDGKVPYLPQWANKRQDNWDHYIDPIGSCYFTGVPRQVYRPRGQAFIQAPGLFAIVSEFGHQDRTIPTDTSPPLGAPPRRYMGDFPGSLEGTHPAGDTTNLSAR